MKPFRVVIQSRLSSSRLPGKALLSVGDRPLVVLCAQRAMRTGLDVIVATSMDLTDDFIVDALKKYNIPFFRGPLNDVLARYVQATDDMGPDSIVVRLCADNVFPDGDFVQEFVDQMTANGLDFFRTSSCPDPEDGLPYGLHAEAFTRAVLKKAAASTQDPFDREHVTPWMKSRYPTPPFKPRLAGGNLGHLRCTTDTFEDYVRVLQIFRDVPDPVEVPWHTLCEKLLRLGNESDCKATV